MPQTTTKPVSSPRTRQEKAAIRKEAREYCKLKYSQALFGGRLFGGYRKCVLNEYRKAGVKPLKFPTDM